jgi:deoxyribodipyrimidine photo-lyase
VTVEAEALREQPTAGRIPDPPGSRGVVVWHREHLRVADHPALATAARADAVLPLFVFDPAFYGDAGLACDARIRFLHECLQDLDDAYRRVGDAGLTYAHGDPLAILRRFVDAGWEVVAMASATGRYGRERDDRAASECDVTFVDGDGLVRDAERTREDWQAAFESWVTAPRDDPALDGVSVCHVPTEVTVAGVESAYDVSPSKSRVPTGGRTEARRRLAAFVERIAAYPGNVSSPRDARDGCSGLSPYLRFGCLSVREVYQYVDDHAPAGRGREMFRSRLAWNKHYEQKLQDWAGWLDTAVNPVLRGFNADHHDPELVAAWTEGRTGYPMVDASMRCLRETGWLNFRMRAMCASFFFHVLQQPWRIGADYYHYHLVDSVAGINYTQWQSQAGLIGKPTLRLYNPRKQVRDQDPEGEWIREWVPELDALPARHLDAPERTPLHVQDECGVHVGTDYPRPVVDYESARERFLDRYERVKPAAAARLGDPAVARRASLSGGRAAARAIAEEHGHDATDLDPGADPDVDSSPTAEDTQRTLTSFADEASADTE